MARVAIRLGVEGKAQVKNDFAEMGKAGEDAAIRWGRKFDEQSAIAERATRRAAEAAQRVAATMPNTDVQARINQVAGISGSQSSARESAQFFTEMDQRARALLATIDPLWAAQQRFNAEVGEARMLLQAGAISVDQYAAAEMRAKVSLDAATAAQQRNNQVTGLLRAGYQQLGFQVGDVTQQVALGVSPFVILAQQGGQLAQAFSMIGDGAEAAGTKVSGLSGHALAFTRFMTGPWGAAVTGGGLILGMLASKLLAGGDAHDRAAEGAEAHEAALKQLRDQIDRAGRSQEQANLITLGRIIKANEATAATRRETLALIEQTKVRQEAARLAIRMGEGGDAGTIEMQRADAELARLQGLADSLERQIKEDEARIRAARLPVFESRLEAQMDPERAAVQRFTNDLAALRREYGRTGMAKAEFDRRYGELANRRDREVEGARASARPSPQSGGNSGAPSRAISAAEVDGMLRAIGAHITSGYRSAEHNRAVGGAANSYHLTDRARDIAKTPGMTMAKIRDALGGVNIRELIDEGDHFHVAWTGAIRSVGAAANDTTNDLERMRNEAMRLRDRLYPAEAAQREAREEDEAIQRWAAAGAIKPAEADDLRSGLRFERGAKALGEMLSFLEPMAEEEKRIAEARQRSLDALGGMADEERDRQSLLRAELNFSSLSERQTERMLMLTELRLDLTRRFGPEYGEQIKQIVAQAEGTERLTQAVQLQRDSLAEVRGIGEHLIDTLFDPSNWENWGETGKRILQELLSDLIRLAAINPIKNWLFDTGLPTLGSLAGAFGGGGKESGAIGKAAAKAPGKGVGGGVKGNAVGTHHYSGGLTWIAENGPELVSLPRGSQITPAAETRRLLAANDRGIGSITIPISIDATGADAAELARVRSEIASLKAELPARIVDVYRDAVDRNVIR